MNMNIREGVKQAYSAAAEKPEEKHPFPVGRRFAESLGYQKELLDHIPSVAIDSFTGVSNVSVFAYILPGSTVLDLGCGAGLDSLIAAEKTGPSGKVTGIDFSNAMISRARQAASQAGFNNVEFHVAEAENLPLEDNSIDIALVNGIFNLSPTRDLIFSELARVIREDGCLYSAELILNGSAPSETSCDATNWFA